MKPTGRGVGEFVTALGVVASLFFVGLEVRENTRAVRGATLQAVSQQSLELTMAGLDNAELRAAFTAATTAESGGLPSEYRSILGWYFSAKLRTDENRFRQVQLGTLDASSFMQLSSHRAYRLAYFAEFWSSRGHQFAPDFQELVEREFLPLAGSALSESR